MPPPALCPQVATALPDIVPSCSECLVDAREQVGRLPVPWWAPMLLTGVGHLRWTTPNFLGLMPDGRMPR